MVKVLFFSKKKIMVIRITLILALYILSKGLVSVFLNELI